MTDQHATRLPPSRDRFSGLVRSRKTVVSVAGLLLLTAAGLACGPGIRRERHRLLVLRNLVEQAAAPDEPVLVDDWLLYRFLRWKGSVALQRQVILTRGDVPVAVQSPSQEMLVIAADADSLPGALRTSGFLLTNDAMQERSLAGGEGLRLPGRGVVRIYFAVRAGAGKVSSHPEVQTP